MLTHRSRTRPAADLTARADTLVRVSHLAMYVQEQLAELDTNPLMVAAVRSGRERGRRPRPLLRSIALHVAESDRRAPVPGHTHAESALISIVWDMTTPVTGRLGYWRTLPISGSSGMV